VATRVAVLVPGIMGYVAAQVQNFLSLSPAPY
jgi:hypothetical protein